MEGRGIDLVARKAEVNCPCRCTFKVSDFISEVPKKGSRAIKGGPKICNLFAYFSDRKARQSNYPTTTTI